MSTTPVLPTTPETKNPSKVEEIPESRLLDVARDTSNIELPLLTSTLLAVDSRVRRLPEGNPDVFLSVEEALFRRAAMTAQTDPTIAIELLNLGRISGDIAIQLGSVRNYSVVHRFTNNHAPSSHPETGPYYPKLGLAVSKELLDAIWGDPSAARTDMVVRLKAMTDSIFSGKEHSMGETIDDSRLLINLEFDASLLKEASSRANITHGTEIPNEIREAARDFFTASIIAAKVLGWSNAGPVATSYLKFASEVLDLL